MKKIVTLALILGLTACSYSDGDRAGQVVKLSRKGYIFKTYEGELATLAKGQVGTMVNNSFKFTVKDEEVAKKLQESMNNGSMVSIHYEQDFFAFPWEGETTYFITGVNINK